MTEKRTNSEIAAPSSLLSKMEYIRVTSLKDFDECPDRWRVKYMDGLKQLNSSASNIGTAVHDIVEMHIHSAFDKEPFVLCADTFKKAFVVIPENEVQNMSDYAEQLINDMSGMELIAVEFEFQLENIIKDMPPIRGHIDAVFMDAEGHYVIVDHKTNRSGNDETWWSNQIQPQLYALAIYEAFKPRSLSFRIGYVNLGYNVEWPIVAEDHQRTLSRVEKIWKDMAEYEATYEYDKKGILSAHWPRVVTQGCQYCPIKNRCAEYSQSINNFAISFAAKREFSLSERLEFVSTVEKLAAAEKESLKEIIKARVLSSESNEFDDGEYSWQVIQKSQRHIFASNLIATLGGFLKNDRISVQEYQDCLDTIMSVKVTGVDVLIKQLPGIKDDIGRITIQKNIGGGTLKQIKNKHRIAGTQGIGALEDMMKKDKNNDGL